MSKNTNILQYLQRVGSALYKWDSQNNRLIISIIYAPTLSKCENNPDQANRFCNKIKTSIKTVRYKDNLIIAGDFKTGSAALETYL